MKSRMLLSLKVIVAISTFILAVIGIMYVFGFVSGGDLKNMLVKVMAIIGIIAVASLVTVLLMGENKD